jgi:hypothetical protein
MARLLSDIREREIRHGEFFRRAIELEIDPAHARRVAHALVRRHLVERVNGAWRAARLLL